MNAPDDDTWLDALRGRPASKSDASVRDASALRQAVLDSRAEQHRADSTPEIKEVEQLLLRLRREGLLESGGDGKKLSQEDIIKILQLERGSTPP